MKKFLYISILACAVLSFSSVNARSESPPSPTLSEKAFVECKAINQEFCYTITERAEMPTVVLTEAGIETHSLMVYQIPCSADNVTAYFKPDTPVPDKKKYSVEYSTFKEGKKVTDFKGATGRNPRDGLRC